MKRYFKLALRPLLHPLYTHFASIMTASSQFQKLISDHLTANVMRVGPLYHTHLNYGATSHTNLFASNICRIEDFLHPDYHRICDEQLRETPRFHRKQWEWAVITHTLRQHRKLGPQCRGLGFGVGTEPLSSIFVSYGCTILGTDAPLNNIDPSWAVTNEHSSSITTMYHERILPRVAFEAKCNFLELDMNNTSTIPTDYDFHWSSCVIEHLGGLDHAITFLIESATRLAPGGIAVHTTEFNLTSDTQTYDGSDTCIFRMKDFQLLDTKLAAAGITLLPMVFDPGSHPYNYHVDIPPYQSQVHTRLMLGGYASTSVVLVIHKPS